MSNLWRVIVTVVMWAALATVSIVALGNNFMNDFDDWAIVVMTLAPLGMALGGTVVLWDDVIKSVPGQTQENKTEAYEKPKRAADDKLALLMSMMDDDERDAFKERLKREVISSMRLSDEGELPVGLDSLLDDDSHRQRRN